MEKEIYKSQIDTINLAKKHLKLRKKTGVDISISPFCDFVIWADCIGNEKIKLFIKNKLFSFDLIKNFIKEFLGIIINSNHSLIKSKIDKKKKYNIIYSYCSKENFGKDGFFYDRYFNYKSNKKKNTYWFLISLDNYVPKKIKNLTIIYKKNRVLNLINFFKFVFKNLFKRNFLDNTNVTSFNSAVFAKYFFQNFEYCKFNLYIPYENRPHQNAVIEAAKRISKFNKVFGYYHRMPEPFQSEMIYKVKNLDKLYICSKPQKKVFVKYFSWPSQKLKIINSIRYSKLSKRKKFIFLPFEIKDINNLFGDLKKLLKFKHANINGFKISIHPLKKNNKKHINLKHMIKDQILVNLKSKSKKLDAPIIMGEPGSVASEILDTIGRVYHISNSHLDIFSEKIWPNIKVVKLSNSIYEYVKIGKVKLLNTNGKKNNFEKLLKNQSIN